MFARSVVQVVLAQVVPVEQDASLVRVVQPRQQLDERRLARAVLADQREHLARVQREATDAAPPTARRPDR